MKLLIIALHAVTTLFLVSGQVVRFVNADLVFVSCRVAFVPRYLPPAFALSNRPHVRSSSVIYLFFLPSLPPLRSRWSNILVFSDLIPLFPVRSDNLGIFRFTLRWSKL